jgi:hypothetical protein
MSRPLLLRLAVIALALLLAFTADAAARVLIACQAAGGNWIEAEDWQECAAKGGRSPLALCAVGDKTFLTTEGACNCAHGTVKAFGNCWENGSLTIQNPDLCRLTGGLVLVGPGSETCPPLDLIDKALRRKPAP